MTLTEQLITIAMGVAGVQLFRFLPFWVFPANRPVPQYIKYLGKVFPAAIFSMLIVYCYRNIDLTSGDHGLPDIIAGVVTLVLHFWRKNMFLSILVGTGLYMFLVQAVFI
ncbi:MAG: branched-chain amino acid transporter permease [Pasteurellaceae bacterium]|nr:branched-chain amino acid transporter permease [Pasteurellaceae bacterium]